jgi:hypothetical protein
MRMVDLFKAKPNWRTLIASDGTGRYRLNLPERPAARVAHRAYRRLRLGLLARVDGTYPKLTETNRPTT